jgi:hypothetical protein
VTVVEGEKALQEFGIGECGGPVVGGENSGSVTDCHEDSSHGCGFERGAPAEDETEETA